jgi:hypothetical protein
MFGAIKHSSRAVIYRAILLILDFAALKGDNCSYGQQ